MQSLWKIHRFTGPQPYRKMCERMNELILHSSGHSHMLLLEHAPTFTAGRRMLQWTESPECHRLRQRFPECAMEQAPRGGMLTFHGPGQLVAYVVTPIPDRSMLRPFVRALEHAMVDTVARFGIHAKPFADAGIAIYSSRESPDGSLLTSQEPAGHFTSGGWNDPRKLGFIGLHYDGKRWLTHGISLNVNSAVERYFAAIDPCGHVGLKVTSMQSESGQVVSIPLVADAFASVWSEQFATTTS